MPKFNISDGNYITQDFSLPSPFIRYLMIKVDFKNLKKLYKTCKYFYARLQINIIDDLYLCKDGDRYAICCYLNDLIPKGYPQRINAFGWATSQFNQMLNNIWLTGDLSLWEISDKCFSKIIRCDILDAYIAIDLTINELEFFTRSQTIKSIIISQAKIYLSPKKTEIAPLEVVLSCLLSARSFRIEDCFVTKNTMKKLLLLNFHEKIYRLGLWKINQMLDANLMDKFLLKNLEDNALVQFVFENRDDNRQFLPKMFAKINEWFPEERKPRTFPDAFTRDY